MEYLSRIHHIAAPPKSPRVIVKIERKTRKVHRTDYLHVDVQRLLKKKAGQVLNSFLSMRRDSEQDIGHFSDLDRRKSGTLLVKTVHKEDGTKLQSK